MDAEKKPKRPRIGASLDLNTSSDRESANRYEKVNYPDRSQAAAPEGQPQHSYQPRPYGQGYGMHQQGGYGQKRPYAPGQRQNGYNKNRYGQGYQQGGYQQRPYQNQQAPASDAAQQEQDKPQTEGQTSAENGTAPRPAYNQQGGYQQRPYNPNRQQGGYNRQQGGYQQRPYNPNRQQGGYQQRQGAYNPNRQQGGYQQRPYNPNRQQNGYGQQGGYQQRPYNPNRQQNGYGQQRQQGGYQQRQGGYQPNRQQGNYGQQHQNRQNFNQQGGFRKKQNMRFIQRPKQIEYVLEDVDPDAPIRLNKFMANAGICSRREADDFIQKGLVKVNGEVVTELGTKINRTDVVEYDEKVVTPEKKCYVLLNKPKDCVTTSEDPNGRTTVLDLVKNACQERIYPVGRLDRNTTGVLLLTNDGDLASKLTHPKFVKKKIYHVWTDKDITEEDMQRIADGIELDDGEIHADAISYVSETDRNQAGIEIHSGRNRIVRRIFEHLGYRVTKLDRVYFAGLTKKNLPRGRWRYLTQEEVNYLRMGAFE